MTQTSAEPRDAAELADPDATELPDPTQSDPPGQRPRWSRFWRHPATRWVGAVILVVVIIALTITAFGSLTNGSGPNDPRSSRPDGAGAGGAVLRQEGVDIRPTRSLNEAVRDSPGATLVVAFPDRLTAGQARRLLEIPDARIILLAPRWSLDEFGVEAESAFGSAGALPPQCTGPGRGAGRADPVPGRLRLPARRHGGHLLLSQRERLRLPPAARRRRPRGRTARRRLDQPGDRRGGQRVPGHEPVRLPGAAGLAAGDQPGRPAERRRRRTPDADGPARLVADGGGRRRSSR